MATLLMDPSTSHKRIRDMEHELFQSKLKPLVDANLLSKIIGSSSSGESPHRTAAMELIFERSIQERRERTLARVRESPQPGPVPEPKRRSEKSNAPIQPADAPIPAPAPQQKSRPPPKPQPTPGETDQNPLLASVRKTTPAATQSDASAQRKSVPNSRKSDSKPPDDTFLRCSVKSCGVPHGRDGLKDGLYCGVCPNQTATLCAYCGVHRSTKVRNCKGCGLRFLK